MSFLARGSDLTPRRLCLQASLCCFAPCPQAYRVDLLDPARVASAGLARPFPGIPIVAFDGVSAVSSPDVFALVEDASDLAGHPPNNRTTLTATFRTSRSGYIGEATPAFSPALARSPPARCLGRHSHPPYHAMQVR